MIYFTSDLHFGHLNIIKYCNRPFLSVEEMDNALIDNWNRRVNKNDTVYILGDFMKNGDYKTINNYLLRLNGSKILILGNHDDYIKKNHELLYFSLVSNYEELEIEHKQIILFHYPIIEWKNKNSGSICLHGHTHAKKRNCFNIKNLYDVGVDANTFSPITLQEIIETQNEEV